MRPVLEVADVFRRHGAAFRDRHDAHLGRIERRVIAAIEACRTPALGGHVEQCSDCGLVRCAYNSCRNRHCPKCQGLARAEWLEARQAELLPVPYFHVVFTLPPAAAEIAFQNKRVVYAILFRAAAGAMRDIAAEPRHLGAEIGAVAVLHSWGQAMTYHPHLHCIVPAGGLSPDQARWVACRPGFFLPVRVLSRRFRQRFVAGLRAASARGELRFSGALAALAEPAAFAGRLADLLGVEWVVYAKPPFAGPDAVLAYLGRYTHRVAIANSRLTQLSHRCSCDSSKAAENCGVPKPPPICGAKESLPFSWVFGLTGSTTVWWHSWPRKAFRSAGRQKSRLCRDFRSVTSPNSPTSPGRCGA
jgi:hypothetical protein